MPTLEMDTVAGLIKLDEVDRLGYGFQAVDNLTGMGLTLPETQWVENAGDGARFRYSREESRYLDLNLLLLAPDRAGLKSLVDKFSLAMSGPITLRWRDGGEVWSIGVRRVGGGSVVYGEDTLGLTELRTIVTLRSESPYWTRALGQAQVVSAGSNLIRNAGSGPASPVWKLTGPLTKFSARSPDGRKFTWTGTLAAGQTLTIDTSTGAVSSGGESRYHELDIAPKLWALSPGDSSVQVELEGSGSATVSWNPKKWMVI